MVKVPTTIALDERPVIGITARITPQEASAVPNANRCDMALPGTSIDAAAEQLANLVVAHAQAIETKRFAEPTPQQSQWVEREEARTQNTPPNAPIIG